jgi:hypothetical protein
MLKSAGWTLGIMLAGFAIVVGTNSWCGGVLPRNAAQRMRVGWLLPWKQVQNQNKTNMSASGEQAVAVVVQRMCT